MRIVSQSLQYSPKAVSFGVRAGVKTMDIQDIKPGVKVNIAGVEGEYEVLKMNLMNFLYHNLPTRELNNVSVANLSQTYGITEGEASFYQVQLKSPIGVTLRPQWFVASDGKLLGIAPVEEG